MSHVILAQGEHADWYYLDSKHEFEFVAGMIAPHERALDVCIGRGAFATLIGNSDRYVGLDLSDRTCESAGAGLDAAMLVAV